MVLGASKNGKKPAPATTELERIRRQLEYPPGARRIEEDGSVTYTKAPLSSVVNLQIILGQDGDFYPHLGYNEFTGETTWAGEPFSDHLETAINCQIAEKYKLKTGTERVRELMILVARQHPYHPIRDYLQSLTWDGVPRIDRLLVQYVGAEDVPLNRALARRWLFGCIARVMRPGCQMDTTLILVGKQGAGKSSFFRSMVPRANWFSDTAMDLASKDAFQQLHGVWIYEVAELSALRVKDAESVKAFLTARVDRYRPAYARNMIRIERQVVFVGTTNEAEFLDDPTGARRFWPVQVDAIKLDELERDRDQLWAEAFELFETEGSSARWHLTEEEASWMQDRHSLHARTDSWKDLLADYMSQYGKGEGVPMDMILSECLELEKRDQHRGNAMRVASLLTSLGYQKGRSMRNGVRSYRWRLV